MNYSLRTLLFRLILTIFTCSMLAIYIQATRFIHADKAEAAAVTNSNGGGLFIELTYRAGGWKNRQPYTSDVVKLWNNYNVPVGGYSNLQVKMKGTQEVYKKGAWYQVQVPLILGKQQTFTSTIAQSGIWRIPAKSSLRMRLKIIGYHFRCHCQEDKEPDLFTPSVLLFDGSAQLEDSARTNVFIRQSVDLRAYPPSPGYDQIAVSSDCHIIGSGSLDIW